MIQNPNEKKKKKSYELICLSSVDSYALEQTLVFIKTIMSQADEIYCSDGSKPIYQHHPVAAVIGAASSQVSVMVASMLQLFKVNISFHKIILLKNFEKLN